MSNSYLRFSFAIKDTTPEERSFLDEYQFTDAEGEEDPIDLCFTHDKGHTFVYCDEGGDIERTANLLQLFLQAHREDQTITFQWAEWCDKARPNSFGGGAVLIASWGGIHATRMKLLTTWKKHMGHTRRSEHDRVQNHMDHRAHR